MQKLWQLKDSEQPYSMVSYCRLCRPAFFWSKVSPFREKQIKAPENMLKIISLKNNLKYSRFQYK
jgi:hypothetical protein